MLLRVGPTTISLIGYVVDPETLGSFLETKETDLFEFLEYLANKIGMEGMVYVIEEGTPDLEYICYYAIEGPRTDAELAAIAEPKAFAKVPLILKKAGIVTEPSLVHTRLSRATARGCCTQLGLFKEKRGQCTFKPGLLCLIPVCPGIKNVFNKLFP